MLESTVVKLFMNYKRKHSNDKYFGNGKRLEMASKSVIDELKKSQILELLEQGKKSRWTSTR